MWIDRPPAKTTLPGMKMLRKLLSPPCAHALFVTFLACPRKVTQRMAPGENSLRQGSVVLGTFRKLALPDFVGTGRAQTVRNALPSDSVAWLNFRMGTNASGTGA